MDKIDHIVVGLDFSDCSRAALMQALRMAAWNRARVHVLHVFDYVPFVANPDFPPLGMEAGVEDARLAAERRLKDLVAGAMAEVAPVCGVSTDECRIEVEVRVGSPFVELMNLVHDDSADILLLGTYGLHHRSRRAGALATKCVRKAPAKVMLIRETHAGEFKNIVCCLEFSTTCRRALEQAISLAARDDASLNVLHVSRPPWQYSEYVIPESLQSPEYRDAYTQVCQKELDAFLEPLRIEQQALHFESSIVESPTPARGIVDFLDDHEADLVVMGTRGRAGWNRLLMGTTAERVIRDSPCSVLAVKPDDFTYHL